MSTLTGRFLETCERLPEKLFVRDVDGSSYAYSEMRELAAGFAAHLEGLGLRPGDRVMLMLPNSALWCAAYLGTLMAGCIALPLDVNLRRHSIELVARSVAPALFIVDPAIKTGMDGIDTLRIADLGSIRSSLPTLKTEIKHHPVALILFTSGTTGESKGVQLGHDNLCFSADSIIGWSGWREDDVDIGAMALSHLFAIAHLHCNFFSGSSVLLFDGMSDAENVLDTAIRLKATALPTSPAGLKVLADYWPEKLAEVGRNLRRVITNHATMPEELVKSLLGLLPETDIFTYYGLTEASRCCVLHYNRHLGKLKTVGRPVEGVELKIKRPPETEDDAGEIYVRGPNLTRGYWGEGDEGTESAGYFEDGWFATGDLGRLDEDGFVTVLGRVRDQINVDGLKCSPEEVEKILCEHPGVEECAAVGLPDAITSERVVAAVVAADPSPKLALALRKHCKNSLEPHKIPKEVFFVDGLPRTGNGKLQRAVLRQELLRGGADEERGR